MAEVLKILKIDHRIWWAIFLILQVFIVAVMVGSLSTTKWVELDVSSETFKYKGSLIKVTEGLTAVPNIFNANSTFDLEGFTYEKVGCSACFVVDVLDEATTPEPTLDFYNSWCKMFKRLWFSAGLFICFEVLSLVCIGIFSVILVLFMSGRFYWRASFYSGGCLWISHYVAIIGWLSIVKLTFDDDCDEVTDGDKPPKVCVKDGPKLGIFVLALLPFVMVPYFLVAVHARKIMAPANLENAQELDRNVTTVRERNDKKKENGDQKKEFYENVN